VCCLRGDEGEGRLVEVHAAWPRPNELRRDTLLHQQQRPWEHRNLLQGCPACVLGYTQDDEHQTDTRRAGRRQLRSDAHHLQVGPRDKKLFVSNSSDEVRFQPTGLPRRQRARRINRARVGCLPLVTSCRQRRCPKRPRPRSAAHRPWAPTKRKP